MSCRAPLLLVRGVVFARVVDEFCGRSAEFLRSAWDWEEDGIGI